MDYIPTYEEVCVRMFLHHHWNNNEEIINDLNVQ